MDLSKINADEANGENTKLTGELANKTQETLDLKETIKNFPDVKALEKQIRYWKGEKRSWG